MTHPGCVLPWCSYVDKTRCTKNDGLVFMPVTNPYYRTQVLKWKPPGRVTIDFIISESDLRTAEKKLAEREQGVTEESAGGVIKPVGVSTTLDVLILIHSILCFRASTRVLLIFGLCLLLVLKVPLAVSIGPRREELASMPLNKQQCQDLLNNCGSKGPGLSPSTHCLLPPILPSFLPTFLTDPSDL